MENKTEKKPFDFNYLSVGLIYLWALIFLLATPQIKDPASRMFPIGVSVFAILLATVLLVRTKRGKSKEDALDFKGGKLAMIMALLLMLYVGAIELVGFYFATPFYLYFTMIILGQKNKKTIAIISILMPILVYVFFDMMLGMEIPLGMLLPKVLGQ